jgi:hypothetical protein
VPIPDLSACSKAPSLDDILRAVEERRRHGDAKRLGGRREYAIQIMDELQKDEEAGWVRYTMEVMREGRVVWRLPFDRPSLPT